MEECVGNNERDCERKMYGNYKEKKKTVKRCRNQNTKTVNEQFGEKMNQDSSGKRKMF